MFTTQKRNENAAPVINGVYLTRKEVADRFGVEVRTVDNWRRRYRLPFYKVGGGVRFKAAEVDAWAKRFRRAGPVVPAGLGGNAES